MKENQKFSLNNCRNNKNLETKELEIFIMIILIWHVKETNQKIYIHFTTKHVVESPLNEYRGVKVSWLFCFWLFTNVKVIELKVV